MNEPGGRRIAGLRRQAEDILGQSGVELAAGETAVDIQSVLHELRVHQIELEIQNEELRDAHQVVEAAKQKAEEVRDRFMRLFHEAPVGYAAVDRTGMIHAANQTLREMSILAPDIPLGRVAFASLLHPDDEHIFRARFPAFFDQPIRKRMELRLRREQEQGEGAEFWVEITGRAVSWRSARTPGSYAESQLLVIISDIRERRKMEAELGLAARVFENSPEGILITDPGGKILRVNEAFTVATGYREEEVLGRTPGLLNSGRQSPEFYQRMRETLVSRGLWQGEIFNRCKNGEIRAEWLHIRAVYNANGKITNYISFYRYPLEGSTGQP